MQNDLLIKVLAESQTAHLPLSHSAAGHNRAVCKRSAEAAPSNEWSSLVDCQDDALSLEDEHRGQKRLVYQNCEPKSTFGDSTNEVKWHVGEETRE